MDPALWLAFVLSYTVISLIPGPSVMMVLGQALSHGLRVALLCVLGDLAGGVVVMTASYLGVGAILATSATAFLALKWLGVGYMIWLGLAQLRKASHAAPPSATRGLRAGFLTGVLNPKAILFYMAFLTQFIDPAAPQLPQFLILLASASTVVALVLIGYALLAARLRAHLTTSRARRHADVAGGVSLLGGGALMAWMR